MYKEPLLPATPMIAASQVYNVSLFAWYSKDVDLLLHGISGFLASDWHPVLSKCVLFLPMMVESSGPTNIGLKSPVGESTGTLN